MLIGGFNPPEKYEISWDDDIPNCFWKVIQNSMVPVTTKQHAKNVWHVVAMSPFGDSFCTPSHSWYSWMIK